MIYVNCVTIYTYFLCIYVQVNCDINLNNYASLAHSLCKFVCLENDNCCLCMCVCMSVGRTYMVL